MGLCSYTIVVILQVHFEKIWQFEFGKITVSKRIKDYIRSLKRAVFFLYIKEVKEIKVYIIITYINKLLSYLFTYYLYDWSENSDDHFLYFRLLILFLSYNYIYKYNCIFKKHFKK